MRNDRMINRRNRRPQEQKDVYTGCVLLQIFICLVLISAVFVMKKQQNFLYLDVREMVETKILSDEGINFPKIYKDAVDVFANTIEEGVGGLWEVDKDSVKKEVTTEKLSSFNRSFSSEPLKPPEGASFAPFMVTCDMKLPLEKFTLTSTFGYRNHPITEKLDFHRGIDLAAPQGENVYASFYGEVTDIGVSKIYGNYIEITHSKNLKTVYSHCDKIVAKKGMKVKTGDRIATVGSTGISTGPHVHFEVVANDKYCDPMWIFEDKIYEKNTN